MRKLSVALLLTAILLTFLEFGWFIAGWQKDLIQQFQFFVWAFLLGENAYFAWERRSFSALWKHRRAEFFVTCFGMSLIGFSLFFDFGLDRIRLVQMVLGLQVLVLFFQSGFWFNQRWGPSRFVLVSFLGLILFGTLMLKMPRFHLLDLSWADSLFLAASAACVTGLSTVDISQVLSPYGQFTLMVIFQLGGIGLVVLVGLISILAGKKAASSGKMASLASAMSLDTMSGVRGMILTILGATFVLELTGAIVLYWLDDGQNGFFWALFHSVSAFCNAGFSLQSDSLEGFSTAGGLLTVMSVLIVFGGLGFPIFLDIFHAVRFKMKVLLRSDKVLDHHGRAYHLRLRVQTWVAVKITIFLILFGIVMIAATEYHHFFAGKPLSEVFLGSFFQSITLRTAGFNTIPVSELQTSTLILFMFMMVIGAGPVSTGGGIKTLTLFVLLVSVKALIRGGHDVVVAGRRSVSSHVIRMALSVFFLYFMVLGISVFLLSITESTLPLQPVLFEAVSALSTVGLSTGITSELSVWGKFVVVLTMIIGRVGPVTLVLGLLQRKNTGGNWSYPHENITIG